MLMVAAFVLDKALCTLVVPGIGITVTPNSSTLAKSQAKAS